MTRRAAPETGGAEWVEPRLVIERAGHQVVVDGQGLAIDGERVCRTPLTPAQAVRPGQHPSQNRAFQVLLDGGVVYRGRLVAEIGRPPPGTANPGPVTVYGPHGPEWHPPAPGERQRSKPGRPLPDQQLQAAVDTLQTFAEQRERRRREEDEIHARGRAPDPTPDHSLEISR
ncbi:hypothetical protein ACIGZJ_36125 [Kitasatospora sp. NPDC052868]|uniref:hypothetical protein n=1 Tax=Kitasatospora sp. NPDC052868 TaxID=3364060 RepID=UPI0037CC07B8